MKYLVWLTPMLALWSQNAHATNIEICIKADVSYNDVAASHDFYLTNGPKPARGIHFVFTPSVGPPSVYHASEGGLTPGCATVASFAPSYTIKVIAQVSVDDHEVSVRNSGSGTRWTYTFGSRNTSAGDQTFTLPVSRKWNIAAAAGHALWRGDGGRPELTVDYYTTDSAGVLNSPCGTNVPCITTSITGSGSVETDVYIDTDRAFLKFATVYALGWGIIHDMGLPTISLTADDTHCGPQTGELSLDSLEYTGAGIAEGYAHFYAATAFNRTTDATCPYVYWRDANWDQLDFPCFEAHEALAGHEVDCASGPALQPLEDLVPDRNYRGYCQDRAPGVTLPNDTIVPIDAVRLWFDVVKNTSLSRNQVGISIANSAPWTGASMLDELTSATTALGVSATTWDDALEEHGLTP